MNGLPDASRTQDGASSAIPVAPFDVQGHCIPTSPNIPGRAQIYLTGFLLLCKLPTSELRIAPVLLRTQTALPVIHGPLSLNSYIHYTPDRLRHHACLTPRGGLSRDGGRKMLLASPELIRPRLLAITRVLWWTTQYLM